MENFNVLKLLGIDKLPDPGWPPSYDDLPDPLQSGFKTPTPTPSPLPSTASHMATEGSNPEPGLDSSPALPSPPPDGLVELFPPGGSSEPFSELFAALSQPSSATLTAQSASSPPASSAFPNLFSPTISLHTVGSPTAPKRHGHTPSKSRAKTPYQRPVPKSQRQPVPGEDSFQLDPSVAPLFPPPVPSEPLGIQPNPRKRRGLEKYAACKCPDGLTSKPARHWRSCPYNPERDAEGPVVCDICGVTCKRKDNMKRHMEDYH